MIYEDASSSSKGPPRSIGPYLFERIIGRGASSIILLATNRLDAQQYAVKVIQRSYLADNPKRLLAFEREITIFSKLHHPNILKFIELLSDDDYVYLVLEYCVYGDMFRFISKNGGLSEKDAKIFVKQIIAAVAYIHELGIAHRDIKLDNILIDRNFHVKLADFGFCCEFSPNMSCTSNYKQNINNININNNINNDNINIENSGNNSSTNINGSSPLFIYDRYSFVNTKCGSPYYAAPELLTKDSYNPMMSDCWSLGVSIYTLVRGRYPWENVDNESKLYYEIITARYHIPETFSIYLRNLVQALMHPVPEMRLEAAQAYEHPWFSDICIKGSYSGDRLYSIPSVDFCGATSSLSRQQQTQSLIGRQIRSPHMRRHVKNCSLVLRVTQKMKMPALKRGTREVTELT
ncbi:CAMK family protein kinase [Tritrichomonas foetus]|uniref:CAMK family protein kinase n=1 Tax=Tritrichomonas foetus TaxID=1144522 RepID=A0A1J4JBD3_9EUKA|nr:CAMK family protein kinase [Tritrichomonas foetus]|eukprot:OHS96494.1 CAMK family protein kinase [Tritrichomonas foetus]